MEKVLNQILEKLVFLEQGQQQLRQETNAGIQQLRQETEAGIQQLRQETNAGIQKLRQETNAGIQKVESKVDKLELRIENKVIEKIRALFDDRSVNQDYFASIKDSLARIEDRVEFLARQNIEHFDKLQKHDRELRLLRTERK